MANLFLEKTPENPKGPPLPHPTSADVIQVAAGFREYHGRKLDGFGLLAPSRENRNFLGVLFPSALFPGRAPGGGALLSFFFGGRRNLSGLKYTDRALAAEIGKILQNDFGVNTAPDLLRIFRYKGAIPQYDSGTPVLRAMIEKIESQYAGLHLLGNVRDGIGLPDRIVQAVSFARKEFDGT